ncbi:Fur family transcriptional regulator [Saccharicrinis fermentans]|uniref:Ferric uptake regulator family protein n=1 Tax=Saccharicrinis fermentans DSM 9555 = JCM 21142 TaxID=869213 RepID=W7Y629_9BACT|nr:transcriptional repressor [Saccharicrinis fermentans]GAF03602.1 ferric uptake regulator family protein [Saccharicrinis fermentans DSM 9555 = JCM 21142]
MKSIEILNTFKIKGTGCRLGILDLMISSGIALSENEIRKNLEGKYNRTTFYRSFKTLEERSVIHKIVVDNQLVKYELDNSVTRKKEHAHFYCNKCNTVKCLDTIEIATPTVPKDYKITEQELILKGECNICAINNQQDNS